MDRSGYPVVSTDSVRVNGAGAGTATFRNATWENWATLGYQVNLHKGTNTVTFTRKTFYAELDAVDVY